MQNLITLWDIMSSEMVTNTKQTWISKASSSILNSVLLLIAVHYFNMSTQERKLKRLSETRFGSIIFFCRMGGIPLRLKKVSTIYAVYMITVITCFCSTYIGMFVDACIPRDDLRRTMTTVRLLLPMTNMMWTFSYCK
jgi:hypothetical protein